MRGMGRRRTAGFAVLAVLALSVLPAHAGRARTADPGAWALAALRAQAARFGVDAAAFRVDSVRESLVGTHVRGRAYRDGIPVAGSAFVAHVADGAVRHLDAYDHHRTLSGAPAARPLAADEATRLAHAALGVLRAVPATPKRLLVPVDGRLVDVWRVGVLGLTRAVARTVDIANETGLVVGTRDESVRDGSATIFDPNPIVTLRRKVSDPHSGFYPYSYNGNSADLTKALRTVPLQGLGSGGLATGRLTGPYADVQGPQPFSSTTLRFGRTDPRFEAAMAYAHIDRVQRHLQSLGLHANREPQTVYALPLIGYDQSLYYDAMDAIIYGDGGVADAEDAEIVLHEYGHAIHYAQVPGWGATDDGGAMGEGWGDFLAAAYYARTSGGYGDLCVGEWDAVGYSEPSECLRRMDSRKRYPDDLHPNREVHADGELWSAFLWRLRNRLGTTAKSKSDNALKLVVTSHEFLTGEATFGHAVAALRTAAQELRRPDWAAAVDREANVTGFPLNPQ